MRRRRTSAVVLVAMAASTLTTSAVTATAQPAPPSVVVSQVYGGGGNAGATFANDYVEVFNRGEATVDLGGLSLQYGSATGTGNIGANAGQLVALSGSVAPGGYHLVRLAGGANGAPVPDPDQTGTINASATAGKVALVDGTAGLGCNGGSTPCDADQLARIVDLVGYGNADFSEGGTTAPTLSATTAAFRADEGCTDTDDNAADFAAATPAPRSSATDPAPCGDGEPGDAPVVPTCADLTVAEGEAGAVALTASDADGVVTEATITAGETDGITLEDLVPATETGGSLTVDLAAAATLPVSSTTVTVTFANADDVPQTATCEVTVTVTGDLCEVPGDDVTTINQIQGAGATTPIPGERVVTRGVVTSDFTSGGATGIPANEGLRGFHIEAVAADRDDDPATSEGLFVFDGAGTFAPQLGTLVHVEGVAGEAFDITQVDADRIVVCDDDPAPLPPPADLPLPTPVDERGTVFEALESMRVVHDELTVVEFFQIERFGEVRLSSDGVLQNPTNVVEPGSTEYEALLASNAANNIILDDGRSGQNLDPLPYVEAGDTLRIGDTVSDVPAIMHFGFNGQWRLQPVDIEAFTEAFQDGRTRPRPQTPPDVGGTLTIAAFNVLNYFNGDGFFAGDDPDAAAGFPTSRGAVTPSEFERQTEKIVDALVRMDADVVGLVEIENDDGDDQAAAALVDAVNTTLGDDVYDYLDTGVIGTDEIKLAFIYQRDTVRPVGDHALLDSSVDPRFDDTRSRPVLAQTFEQIATGETVTVANNHLKSKGSACAGDPDAGDGQGNCNGTRTAAAEAMAEWLAGDPTGQDAAGTLIIGDLNSYAMEDPIDVLKDAGYTDLLDEFAPDGTTPYTYTFDATQGYLDHSLADDGLLPYVTGAAAWGINADEVPAIDYLESGNGRFRTPDVAERFYDPSAFRSSDHDPTLVGLDLAPAPENRPPTVEDLQLTTERDRSVSGQIVADDPDGDTLTYRYGTPRRGSVRADDQAGAFTYTPQRGFTGTDTFEVVVDDGRGGTATATVSVEVRKPAPRTICDLLPPALVAQLPPLIRHLLCGIPLPRW